MPKPFFSIVLPTYNRLYSMRQIFLPSLERQNFTDYELIVVDDASTDETREYMTTGELQREFPQVAKRTVYIRNDKNRGAPGSRNVGALKAVGEWTYIVEDDVQIDDPQYLSRAAEICCSRADSVAVVSPKRAESIDVGYYHNPPRSFARIGVLSGEVYLDPRQEYSGFVPNTHASSFIRREIFLKNLEDEATFFGNTFRDESDVYIRIVRAGNRIWYCADELKTVHRNDLAKSGGQKKVNSLGLLRQELMVERNHYLYLRKHYQLAELRIIFFAFVRMMKIIARLTRLRLLKDVLAWIRL